MVSDFPSLTVVVAGVWTQQEPMEPSSLVSLNSQQSSSSIIEHSIVQHEHSIEFVSEKRFLLEYPNAHAWTVALVKRKNWTELLEKDDMEVLGPGCNSETGTKDSLMRSVGSAGCLSERREGETSNNIIREGCRKIKMA